MFPGHSTKRRKWNSGNIGTVPKVTIRQEDRQSEVLYGLCYERGIVGGLLNFSILAV